MLAEPLQPDAELFRPPAPEPLRRPPDLFAFFKGARTNPLTTWTKAHFEEPILIGDSVLGRVVVLSDPVAIRHVLVDNAANYRKDDLQRRVLASGLGDGLLTAEGETWRVQRRALAPLFSARTVAGFAAPMQDSADRLVRRIRRRGEGRMIDAGTEMARVALDVLERTIFTRGLSRDPDALALAITRYFEAVGPIDPLDVLGLPAWLPRIGKIRARPALRFFEEVVDELIAARRALIASGEQPPRDLLSALLAATDPETGRGLDEMEIKANIVTFIGAGHETTANALSWSLYLLSHAPSVRARLEAEVDELDPAAPFDLARVPLVRAVLEEAMRLYPPAPFIGRTAIADDRVAGYRVPAGAFVTIPPYVLHRHRRLWTRPDHFDPDRFLPGQRERIDRFAYLPFGAGPRICIGASFSLQEAAIVLTALTRAFRLDLRPGHVVVPVQRVTLRPTGGLPMRVTSR